jgi:hypothetical protein
MGCVRPLIPRRVEEAMRRLRFTIANLLGVVLFVAVAVAALRAASEAWDGAVLGLTLLALLVAVLLAVHRADRRRAFWLGFALFGWAYLVAALVSPVEPRLPTTKALAYLDSKAAVRVKTFTISVALNNASGANGANGANIALLPSGSTLVTSRQGAVRRWNVTSGRLLAGTGGTSEDFVRIGHSVLAVVLAFLGGHLSRFLYDRGRGGLAEGPGTSTPPAGAPDIA